MIKYFLLTFLLTGCAFDGLFKPDVPIKPKTPADLLQECPKIQPISDNTFGAIIEHDTTLLEEYAKCRSKHKRLSDGIIQNEKE